MTTSESDSHGAASGQRGRYVPAAGRRGLTRFYDVVLATTMRESLWRPRLVARIADNLPYSGRIVDVGAGTGTLAIALAGSRPDVQVVAVDGDPEIIRMAQAKRGAELVHWRTGLAGELDLEDASADAVVMSLLLHHLDRPTKLRALTDARRILRGNGQLHVADWGRPQDPLMRAAFGVLQLIDGTDGTRDHAAGHVPELIAESGFAEPERSMQLRTAWGTLELLHAPSC